ncbi:hypothetical protein EAH76_02120 [Sphingomonas glacialis]|uniref:Glycosyltransferase RgtA/B/C/D-like domain-containing protein n=2 Tax=Sphingomonas glacialis TaxID=658225 RepID=A0A502G599_9SPHN|nr:hypothetical protein EAH76_02120 [Sphingomonas glacialis]
MTDIDTHVTALRCDSLLRDQSFPTPRREGGVRLRQRIRRSATPDVVFALGAAVYLLLCAFAFFVVRPTTLLYFADYWEHRAIVNEIARHGLHPLDPIYGEQASSRQYTPWSSALGYIAQLGQIGSDTALALGAMAVSLVFIGGVHSFGRVFYRNPWAPAVLLATLLCAWGPLPLIWTGFYAFRSQLHGNYYPAELVFALTFVAWASVLRLLRGDGRAVPHLVSLFAIVACSVITHPLNAAFLVAGGLGFVVLEPGVAHSRRFGAAMVIVLAIAATSFWPYFNPLSLASAGLARGQATFNNFRFFYDPMFVIAMAGPTLFVLLGLPGLARNRSVRMPLIALALTFAAYVIGGIADISVSHRLLAYVFLMLHLLLVKAVLEAIAGRPPRGMDLLTPRAWRGAALGAALMILWQTAMALQQLTNPWASTDRYPVHQVEADTSTVVATLPPSARILGWESAALVMPSHGLYVVALPRPMPLSPSDAARQADYRRFFAPGTSTCRRLTIAHRWGATHVAYLTNELNKRTQRELVAFGRATSPIAPWRVIRVPAPRATGC